MTTRDHIMSKSCLPQVALTNSSTSPAGIQLPNGAGQSMLSGLLAGNSFILNAWQRGCEEKRLLLAKVDINRMSCAGKNGPQAFIMVNYA